MSTTTPNPPTTGRSPRSAELREAGTSHREIYALIDQLRGSNWPNALDACFVLAENPVAARAIAARAMDAVADGFYGAGDVVDSSDLMWGVADLGWIDRDRDSQLRTALQLFDQAWCDAAERTEPDRFAEVVDRDPRTAARALVGAVTLFAHRVPKEGDRP